MIPYRRGDYCAPLDEVKLNVQKFGAVEVCEFVPGYVQDTLPRRAPEERYVLVFEDVDLPTAVESTLLQVWPRLQPGCKFFTHEGQDFPIVARFFNETWWPERLHANPPGLVGGGIGLPLGPNGCTLAYAIKAGGLPSPARVSPPNREESAVALVDHPVE
jgi:hypothetical protein